MKKCLIPVSFVALALILAACSLPASQSPTVAASPLPTVSLPKLLPTATSEPTQKILPTAVPTLEPIATTAAVEPTLPAATLTGPTLTPAVNTLVPLATSVTTQSVNLLGTVSPLSGTEPAGISEVKIYMIALNDGGAAGVQVACSDSAVPVTVSIAPTYGVLRAALDKLLALKTKNYNDTNLYNPLYQSSLSIDKLTLQNNVASIYLKGNLTLPGECDDGRVKAQIEYTARQFATIQKVEIYINNQVFYKSE